LIASAALALPQNLLRSADDRTDSIVVLHNRGSDGHGQMQRISPERYPGALHNLAKPLTHLHCVALVGAEKLSGFLAQWNGAQMYLNERALLAAKRSTSG
jgi:hypothetical protein